MLGAIALVLAQQGQMVALACAFVALVGSFMISYTRAKAEALGLNGDVGLMAAAERIVLLAVALPFAGLGSLPYVDLSARRAHRDHRRPARRLRSQAARHDSGGLSHGRDGLHERHRTSTRQGARRHRRRRQLRLVARAGRPVLPRRQAGRLRARPDARRPRRLPHLATSSSRPPSTSTPTRSATTSARRSSPRQNNTIKFSDVPSLGVPVHRGMTHDGLGKYLVAGRSPRPRARPPTSCRILQGDQDRRRRLLPAGRLREGDQVVRRAGARRPAARSSTASRSSSPASRTGSSRFEETRPADHRRRHQVAGRRDDHPPHADPPVPRPRRASSSAPTSSTSAATPTS